MPRQPQPTPDPKDAPRVSPKRGARTIASPAEPGRVAAVDKRSQRRIDLNFTNAFAVTISSTLLGESICVARNISCGGMFVECNDPFPLGSKVKVRFTVPAGTEEEPAPTAAMGDPWVVRRMRPPPVELVALAEIKNHYFINYADRGLGPRCVAGMGVRFTGFESDGLERLGGLLARFQLH